MGRAAAALPRVRRRQREADHGGHGVLGDEADEPQGREVLGDAQRTRHQALQALQVSSDGTDLRARLIALAVHDLRNPLASILGNAEYLVQARELGPDSREAAADLL